MIPADGDLPVADDFGDGNRKRAVRRRAGECDGVDRAVTQQVGLIERNDGSPRPGQLDGVMISIGIDEGLCSRTKNARLQDFQTTRRIHTRGRVKRLERMTPAKVNSRSKGRERMKKR